MQLSFPKIWHIGSPQAERLFNGPVEITEKIDGSQFNFGKSPEGELIMRSKGAPQIPGTTDKLFRPVVEWVQTVQDQLPHGTMYHGETICSPRHNTLTYGRVPKGNFMLYGVSQGDVFYSQHFLLAEIAKSLGCEVVPLLFYGEMPKLTEADIDRFMQGESVLGGCKPEGFVIKNYAEQLLIGGRLIPLLAGKFVTEAFKEKHGAEWQSHGDKLELLKQSYKTEARWRKTIQHLRERGELQFAPQDIGPLLKELNTDFIEECKEDVKEALWRHFSKDFTRTIAAGFPEWYKHQLATGELT
jgi:hypothetical protein